MATFDAIPDEQASQVSSARRPWAAGEGEYRSALVALQEAFEKAGFRSIPSTPGEKTGTAGATAGPVSTNYWVAVATAEALAELEMLRAENPNDRFLVLYEHPAMLWPDDWPETPGLGDFLSDAAGRMERLLKAFRGGRRGMMLINARAALAAPGELVDSLSRNLNQLPELAAVKSLSPFTGEYRLVHLVAEQALKSDSTTGRLWVELEASSIPLSMPSPDFSLLLKAEAAVESESPRRVEQEPPEPQALQELQEENEILHLQLHQVQEELEFYYQESQKQVRPVVKQPSARLNYLETELENVKSSLSWKVTAPLRWLAAPFMNRRGR